MLNKIISLGLLTLVSATVWAKPNTSDPMYSTDESLQKLYDQVEATETPKKITENLILTSTEVEMGGLRIRRVYQYTNINIDKLTADEAQLLSAKATASLASQCDEQNDVIKKGITFRHLFRDKNGLMISVVDIEKNRCDYFKALSK
tara:strand:- start:1288 stop:1728 length:441 start_codon:yes stop_codon:yes gene_type:complete